MNANNKTLKKNFGYKPINFIKLVLYLDRDKVKHIKSIKCKMLEYQKKKKMTCMIIFSFYKNVYKISKFI